MQCSPFLCISAKASQGLFSSRGNDKRKKKLKMYLFINKNMTGNISIWKWSSLYYSKCMNVCVCLHCAQQKNHCCSPGTNNNFVLLPAACCVFAKQTVLHSWTTYMQRLTTFRGQRRAAANVPPSGQNLCQPCDTDVYRVQQGDVGAGDGLLNIFLSATRGFRVVKWGD